jgi:hypothetical protein
MTNLPATGSSRAEQSPFEEADLCEVVRLYGLRQWVEQSYKQLKGELGFSDFQVRSDLAIRRHWELVFCAFCFCWWAYIREQEATFMDPAPQTQPASEQAGEKRSGRKGAGLSVMAGSTAAGAQLAGPVGYAVALLESVVESAPATTAASAA